MSTRLQVHGLIKSYPGLQVLQGVELAANAGEIIAIQGTSGTGKSTLLHCLGLIDRPDQGSIVLDGDEVTAMEGDARSRIRAARIGFVFQGFHLLPEFTVEENIIMAARAAGTDMQAAQQRARHLLSALGLEGRHSGDVRTLSGGERQRVAVARALLNKPALLLADEPTGNLDPATADVVLTLMLQLARTDNTAVIIVTHDAAVAARADRRLVLRQGRLEA